jgi:hypothetical protein
VFCDKHFHETTISLGSGKEPAVEVTAAEDEDVAAFTRADEGDFVAILWGGDWFPGMRCHMSSKCFNFDTAACPFAIRTSTQSYAYLNCFSLPR